MKIPEEFNRTLQTTAMSAQCSTVTVQDDVCMQDTVHAWQEIIYQNMHISKYRL